jgi:putative lipoic acid-binding regulatory protein
LSEESDADPFASLKLRLDEEHAWPCVYTFKFIMRTELVPTFTAILAGHNYTTRHSAAGRHVAITAELFMESSDEVIDLYRRAAEFEGVISL